MPKKPKEETTTLHEIYVSLAHFEKRLICHAEGDERRRLLSVFEREGEDVTGFYGFDLVEGLECYVNLAHVAKINVLDYLAGLPFEKPAKRTEKEETERFEEREESDDPVLLRVWTTHDRGIEVFRDVDYQERVAIRFALEESNQHFIGFDDEDGERVILSLAHIAAIEAFDTHYLTDEELEGAFKDNDEKVA
jgi:hypothetical protein